MWKWENLYSAKREGQLLSGNKRHERRYFGMPEVRGMTDAIFQRWLKPHISLNQIGVVVKLQINFICAGSYHCRMADIYKLNKLITAEVIYWFTFSRAVCNALRANAWLERGCFMILIGKCVIDSLYSLIFTYQVNGLCIHLFKILHAHLQGALNNSYNMFSFGQVCIEYNLIELLITWLCVLYIFYVVKKEMIIWNYRLLDKSWVEVCV